MTEAEKAFEKLQAGEWVDDDGIEAIRKALQGVEWTERLERTIRSDIAEIAALKAKSQGLLKEMERIMHATDGLGDRIAIYNTAKQAINNFNSDETGVGL